MISLQAKPREEFAMGMIKAVVYGPGVKNANVAVDEKEFIKVLRKAGESSLVELMVGSEKRPVLIQEIQKDPISDAIIHIDFYQADLKKEVEVSVPLVFEGVAPAEKDLGGTLNKNMQELEVRATPEKLPNQIVVSIENLKTFEDHILVKDIKLPEGVTTTKNAEEVVAAVLPPQDVEADLAAEIKEEVENVEKVAKPEKEEVVIPEGPAEESK